MTEVIRATDDDLETILGWLEREYHEDGESGFWCNRRVIRSSHESEEVYVIREEGEAVSFQVGEHWPDITCTRKDAKRRGYATKLFEAGRERAIRDNVNLLSIDCQPPTSWPFWERRGFKRAGKSGMHGEIPARMEIERRFELPLEAKRTLVHVAFYPEEKLYRDEAVEPVRAMTLESAVLTDGSIQLPRRAVGIKDDLQRGDMVVEIAVDGNVICCEKGKYADGFGVEHDRRGGTFYLDRLVIPDE